MRLLGKNTLTKSEALELLMDANDLDMPIKVRVQCGGISMHVLVDTHDIIQQVRDSRYCHNFKMSQFSTYLLVESTDASED